MDARRASRLRIRIIRSSSLGEGAVSGPEGFRMTVLLGAFDGWIARREMKPPFRWTFY